MYIEVRSAYFREQSYDHERHSGRHAQVVAGL